MLRPIADSLYASGDPAVPPETLAAFLNTEAADQVFRCVSGSVAVSAYELESLPLPSPAQMRLLTALLARGPDSEAIERLCAALYEFPSA
jgi:adenine-specific DNA-methyltransferase